MWDVIVIGGGLAGLISALAAQSEGQGVLLVSQGAGSLSFASGVFDFGDVSMLSRKEKHPYKLFGADNVNKAAEFFLSLLPEMIGKPGESRLVLTPLGEARPSTFVHRSMNADPLTAARQIVLLELEGLKDFFADVVEANLQRSFPQATILRRLVRPRQFQERLRQGQSLTALDYERIWQSSEGKAVWQGLEDSYSDEVVYILPGWLNNPPAGDGKNTGRSDSEYRGTQTESLADANRYVGMSTFPPSAQGNQIYEQLLRAFKRRGGEVAVSRVSSAIVQGSHCQGIWLQGKGKESLYRAKGYILATGGLLGGGIVTEPAHPATAREVVFNLPLYLPEGEHWTGRDFFGEQAYAHIGVEVDAGLSPLDPQTGERLLDNVFIVGRMLAHWDPWSEHCGGGVSITSGYLAGLRSSEFR